MERKRVVSGFVKSEAEGRVRARFAKLGGDIPDKDGDIMAHGSIGEQNVLMSAYGHTSWGGALPVGKGRVFERGDEAIADLQLFVKTPHGADTFNTLVGLGSLAEWSFGYRILMESDPSAEQRALGVKRVLEKLEVHEVSPVIRGAGIDTATLTAKCTDCERGGLLIRGITSGRVEQIEFTGVPSDEAEKQARFAVGFCWRLHRKQLPGCPTIRYFRAVERPWEAESRMGFARSGYVALNDDLQGRALVETALHECRHLAQEGASFTDAAAEQDAEGFAYKWTPIVLRAYRATRGELSRLAVIDKHQPSGQAPHMDVRVTRRNAKLWEYDAQTMGDSWRELSW